MADELGTAATDLIATLPEDAGDLTAEHLKALLSFESKLSERLAGATADGGEPQAVANDALRANDAIAEWQARSGFHDVAEQLLGIRGAD